MVKIEKLLEPTKIGRVELKNRLVMPPMLTALVAADGGVTERLTNYYAQRAKGGVGLIIVEAAAVDLSGVAHPANLRIDQSKFIPGLFGLTDIIHRCGAKCAIQLAHAGRQTHPVITGTDVVAPSPIPPPSVIRGVMPRELTIKEIEGLVEKFAVATVRVKRAKFDAVEIHGAHGYLISQFLSPLSNKRTDKYGGDLEGRMQFAIDIITRMKEEAGKDFPIIFRISGDEFVEGGLTLEENKHIAKKFEDVGVDAIHVSAGSYGAIWNTISPSYIPRGVNVYLAEGIKKVVDIPVIAVGGITPEMAEEIVKDGKADLVSMGRSLIADPELPKKLYEGRLHEINRCIRCNEGCVGKIFSWGPISCSINASVGNEKEYEIKTARIPKKVLIVGGGPAGMEAARVLALRGHDVTLYEKKDRLGGSLIPASVPEFKKDIRPFVEWLSTQIRNLGVKVELKKEVTPQTVDEIKPDVVIVAAGSRPLIPEIPGIKRKNVITAIDMLLGKGEVGNEVIVAGGGSVGCEISLFLAQGGKKVTTVEMLREVATDLNTISRMALMKLLRESDVKLLTSQLIQEITDEGVVLLSPAGRQTIKADTVVLALGMKPNVELCEALKGKVPELYAVGDCVKHGKIMDAVGEASFIARQIGA